MLFASHTLCFAHFATLLYRKALIDRYEEILVMSVDAQLMYRYNTDWTAYNRQLADSVLIFHRIQHV